MNMLQNLRAGAFGLLATGAVVAMPAPVQAQGFVANQIEKLLSSETMQVEIEGLSGALSGAVRIESVTLSDPDGVFLTANDLAMDWSPLALARSNVAIQSLTAARIELTRLPIGGETAEDEAGGGGFSIPAITADIGEIAIAEFILGEAVAGIPARLSANASLQLAAEPTSLSARAAIRRLDQAGDIDLDLAYAPSENRLVVNVSASEPAGGIVAGLLDLPGAPPVNLTISGEGPLSAFAANGTLDIGAERAITIQANVADEANGRRVAATVSTITGPFVPEQYVDIVGERADIAANVLLRDDGAYVIDQGTLASGSLRLAAAGTFDRAGPSTDLSVSLTTPEAAPVPLAFGAIGSRTSLEIASLQARVSGPFSALVVDATALARTAGFEAYIAREATLRLQSSGFNVDALTGPFTVNADIVAASAPAGIAADILVGPIAIAAEGALGENSLTLSPSTIRTAVAELGLSGGAALDFSTFDIALTSSFETEALAAAARPYTGERLAIAGGVARDAEGNLALRELRIEGEGLAVTGTASLAGETIAADITGRLDQAANETTPFSGSATFDLDASGTLDAPAVLLTGRAARLLVGGRELADLNARIEGTFAADAPTATVMVAGTYGGEPLEVSANVGTLPDGLRALSGLVVRQGENSLTGDLTLNAAAQPEGRLAIDAPNVSVLGALAGQDITGDLAGEIVFTLDGQTPVVAVDLTSGSLAAANNSLSGLAADLSVRDYVIRPVATGSLRAGAIDNPSIAISSLVADLADAGEATAIDASVTLNGVPTTFEGDFGLIETGIRLALRTLTAEIENAAIALEAPATIETGAGLTTIEPLALTIGDGRLDLTGSIGTGIDLQLALDGVPLGVANPFVEGLDAAGTLTGTLTAAGSATNPRADFTLQGAGIETSQTRAANLSAFSLDVNGDYRAGTIRLANAAIDLPEGSLTAVGTIGEALDLAVTLDGIPVALANGFVDGLDARGTIEGTLDATGPRDNPNVAFVVTGSGITADGLASSGLEPFALDLAGTLRNGVVILDRALADLDTGAIRATGRFGRFFDLDIALETVPAAIANAFVDGLDATGGISGTARVAGSLAAPDATFALNSTDISAATLRTSGIQTVRLDVAGGYAGNILTFERAVVDAGRGSLSATGTLGRTIEANVTLDSLPLALANAVSPTIGAEGSASGTASVSGTLANPMAAFDIALDAASVAQTRGSGVAPLDATLQGTYADGSATLQAARIDVGAGSLEATGTVGQILDLAVTLNQLPVALANGFVDGLGAQGTLSGTASAQGTIAEPRATFDLTAAAVSVAQTRAGNVPPLNAVARGAYADGTATIETANVEVGTGRLSATGSVGRTLNLSVDIASLPLALADGFVDGLGAQGTLSGSATATGSINNPSANFDVSAAGVSVAQTRALGVPTITAQAAGTYGGGAADLANARIDFAGGGSVTASGRVGQTLDVDVTLNAIPASAFAAAVPDIAPQGTISGTASATGPLANPSAQYDIEVASLSVAQTREVGVGPLNVGANGSYGGGTVTLQALTIAGSGIDFSASGTADVQGTPSFDIDANGTVPLSIANRILAEGGRSVQGTVAVDISASGTAANPNINGTITTSGASFTDTGANLAVNGITTTIALTGQTATIQTFSAQLGAGGTISAGGTVGLTGGFPANLTITADGARYADGELVSTTLDASLTITGDLVGSPLIAGTINAREINILVPDTLPSSLARIDVEYRNAPPAVLRQQRELNPDTGASGNNSTGLTLDITFNAPNQVFVRGRGLDMELGGQIAISGPVSSPSITGGFELQRGRFQILSRRLDFERATLTFSGDLLPTLDLVAVSEAEQVTVRIAITGPANNPSFSFSSTPALPQDEVLARLIFGQGTADLSPLQIAQLASAAAQLAGVGGSTGLLDNLRAQLGVDDLDVRTTADGQAAVGAGRYINENTYVGVDSTGRVSIDLELGANIKARGAVSANGGGEVGIFYEREY